jgi:DNA-binding NarL/FixJ family response regulator
MMKSGEGGARAVVQSWPFTARETELAAAQAALRERGAVVLGGPAGVGKSRLAQEIALRAGVDATVGVVRATASAQEIPLGAFVDVLPGPDPAGASPDLSHLRDAVAAFGSDDDPRLLVVDDAHLLDNVSAAVVHQLVIGRRAIVVLTVRTGEPAPDAVTALWKDDTAARIELEPFGREQTFAVLANAFGGALEAMTARRLHDSARGNVLWLRHLVDGESAAGRLRQERGGWVWRGEVALSPVLGDLVAMRIGTLTDDERRVLELLAIAEPLGLGMLENLAFGDAIEEVAQRGLITVEPDGVRWEVRLGHPLYGESVRARIGEPRSRRLRSELAAALAKTGSRRAGDSLRRALLDLGSDRELDPALLLEAAMQASALSDHPLAERLLRAAIDSGGGFEARAGLAALLSYLLREDEADVVLAEAAAAAATPHERARAAQVRTMFVHFSASDGGSGEAVLAEAERAEASLEDPAGASTDPPPENPEFDGMRAAILVAAGRVAEGVDRAARALENPELSDHAVTLASWAASYAGALSGTGGSMAELVERGISAAVRNPEMASMAANLGFAEILDADLRGRPELAGPRMEWVRGLAGPQAPIWVALFEGRMALRAGLPRAAVRALESALPIFPGHGGGWGGWLTATIAQGHGMLGDASAAREALAEAERRRHPRLPLIDFEYDLARAWAAAAAGNTREAIHRARHGATHCRTHHLHAAEVLLRHTSVRFGDHEQLTRLTELDHHLDTPRAHLAAAHAAALTADDPERLLTTAAQLEEHGMTLEAADAAAQSATTARTRRRPVLAAEAETHAHTLAAHSDDARTPALLEAHTPIALSAREREVATLAGQGLSNRQIAETLHVSIRTIESHIYRACTRLGLTHRTELVAVAGTRRLT